METNEVKDTGSVVDPKIVDAVKNIRGKSLKLIHDANNPHQKYNYASIDKYYEVVVPVCVTFGLTWRARETGWELRQVNDKQLVILKLSFDVFVGDAACMDYMKITVPGPLVGPQTTGQLYSYADKVFMRVAFGVATGEADGDSIKQEDYPRRVLPTGIPSSPKGIENFEKGDVPEGVDPITGEVLDLGKMDTIARDKMGNPLQANNTTVVLPTEESVKAGVSSDGDPIIDTRKINKDSAELIVKIFETWLPKVTTRSRLLDWHAENVAAIETVGKVDPVFRERLKGMFTERNAQLKAKEAK